MTLLLDKYHLPLPVLTRELSFEQLRARSLDILRDCWLTDSRLQEIAPNFEAWLVETPFEALMVRIAAWRDMLFIAEMNDWARALLLVMFTFGADLDQVAANEGLTRFPGESDARLQERVILTRRGKWGPGSDPWYIMHARNLDGRVREVAITGNGRRQIEVAILSDEADGTPSPELIDIVNSGLSRKNICRGNDIISTVPAIIASVAPIARVTLESGAPESVLDGLADAAVAEWNTMPERLGRDLTASWLISRLHVAGVYEVVPDVQTLPAAANRAIGLTALRIEIVGRAR